jgi:hypothetical protein
MKSKEINLCPPEIIKQRQGGQNSKIAKKKKNGKYVFFFQIRVLLFTLQYLRKL